MFKPSQQNLTQLGTELFPDVIQAPIRARIKVEATPDFIQAASDAGVTPETAANDVATFYSSHIQQFVSAQRQQRALGGLPQYARQSIVPGLLMNYRSNNGFEFLDMIARPELVPSNPQNPFEAIPEPGYYVLIQAGDSSDVNARAAVGISNAAFKAGARLVYDTPVVDPAGTEYIFVIKFPKLLQPLGTPAYSITIADVTPPEGGAFGINFLVYPVQNHKIDGSQNPFVPIVATGGKDNQDSPFPGALWCASSSSGASYIGGVNNGTYNFALDRRRYLDSDTAGIRKAVMTYPLDFFVDNTGTAFGWVVVFFVLANDGHAVAFGHDIDSWGRFGGPDAIPAGPPPKLSTDPLFGEVGQLTGALLNASLRPGESRTFIDWT